jgi:hypothetical protein
MSAVTSHTNNMKILFKNGHFENAIPELLFCKNPNESYLRMVTCFILFQFTVRQRLMCSGALWAGEVLVVQHL